MSHKRSDLTTSIVNRQGKEIKVVEICKCYEHDSQVDKKEIVKVHNMPIV